MHGNCKHQFKILREHGEALPDTNWKKLQEQARGRTLFALVTADVSNPILSEMVGGFKRWVFSVQTKKDLKGLLDLQTPMKLVGIYVMDHRVFESLHEEAHAEEDEMDDEYTLVDPSDLAEILQGFGARFGGQPPMFFGGGFLEG